MRERLLQFVRPGREGQAGGVPRRFPLGIVLLLIPSWVTYFILERDEHDTEHPLYYHIPDLTQNPPAVLLNLVVTPLVNTQTDQILLVTALLVAFGTVVERRLGTWQGVGIFWGASSVAALGGGALLHVLYPLFPDVHTFGPGGWERVFNGGSAGGFGLMGAFTATARRPLPWIGLFLLWEPSFWLFVTQDYTSAFHVLAFTTGFIAGRRLRSPRAPARDSSSRDSERAGPAPG